MLLQCHITSLGSKYSIAQRNDLPDRQRKLEARISSYEHRMAVIMKLDNNIQWSRQGGKILNVDLEPEDMPENILELYPDGWFTPEREQITLPSALKQEEIDRLLLNDIATIEFKLHKGQVADTLDKLYLALGEKSLCFRTEVCNEDSQRTTSQAWDNIHKLDTEA